MLSSVRGFLMFWLAVVTGWRNERAGDFSTRPLRGDACAQTPAQRYIGLLVSSSAFSASDAK